MTILSVFSAETEKKKRALLVKLATNILLQLLSVDIESPDLSVPVNLL